MFTALQWSQQWSLLILGFYSNLDNFSLILECILIDTYSWPGIWSTKATNYVHMGGKESFGPLYCSREVVCHISLGMFEPFALLSVLLGLGALHFV